MDDGAEGITFYSNATLEEEAVSSSLYFAPKTILYARRAIFAIIGDTEGPFDIAPTIDEGY